MTLDIRSTGGFQPASLVLLDRLSDCATGTNYDLDAGGLQRPKRIRPTIARQNDLHILVGNQLCRLDPGATPCCRIAVCNRLKRHIVRFYDYEMGTTPEPRIDRVVKRRPS